MCRGLGYVNAANAPPVSRLPWGCTVWSLHQGQHAHITCTHNKKQKCISYPKSDPKNSSIWFYILKLEVFQAIPGKGIGCSICTYFQLKTKKDDFEFRFWNRDLFCSSTSKLVLLFDEIAWAGVSGLWSKANTLDTRSNNVLFGFHWVQSRYKEHCKW